MQQDFVYITSYNLRTHTRMKYNCILRKPRCYDNVFTSFTKMENEVKKTKMYIKYFFKTEICLFIKSSDELKMQRCNFFKTVFTIFIGPWCHVSVKCI